MCPLKGCLNRSATFVQTAFFGLKCNMSLVRLKIKGISYSQTQNGAYALILNEEEGDRKLPIVIGAFEAQSIAIALEKEIKPPRPLTHDLFKNFADRFQIVIKQVIIHKLVDGVFYSSIICERDDNEEIIDARTSDAIALALFNCAVQQGLPKTLSMVSRLHIKGGNLGVRASLDWCFLTGREPDKAVDSIGVVRDEHKLFGVV